MRRRDFIQGIVRSAAAWPFAARAQQLTKLPTISATRKYRESVFLQVLKSEADYPAAKITQAAIIAGRERRAAQARKFLDAMRGLFRWAVAAGLVKTDPTKPKAQDGRWLHSVDGRTRRCVRATMASRHTTAGLARRFTLYRSSSR
jgi:hypothetical protein